jgi:ribose transport system substrate-binding protein
MVNRCAKISVSVVGCILLAVSVTLIAGCKGARDGSIPHIAYITNGVASFWTIAKAGAEKAGRDLQVSVSVHMPAEGITDQKRIVEDLLVRGVDGIAISLIDANNQTSFVNDISSQTKVITQDADAPQSRRLAYVGMDNYRAGRMLGELVTQTLPSGGTLGILVGRIEQDNARKRRQGVIDQILGRSYDPERFDPPGQELTNGSYTIVSTLTDQFDRVKAKSNCEDILLRHPNLSGIIGLFAYNIPACLEALKHSSASNALRLFAFDEADEVLQGIQDGKVVGTVVQNPYEYGYQSIKLLKEIVAGNAAAIPNPAFIDIPARRIDSSNVVEFWSDLRSKVSAK